MAKVNMLQMVCVLLREYNLEWIRMVQGKFKATLNKAVEDNLK